MNQENLQALFLGKQINFIKRTCDLIMFDFIPFDNGNLALHLSCFLRIILGERTLVSSNDIYVCGNKVKRRKFRWDKPNMSLFDECIKENEILIYNKDIVNFEIKNNELKLLLENNVEIIIVPDTVQDKEAYRIFSKNEDYLIV